MAKVENYKQWIVEFQDRHAAAACCAAVCLDALAADGPERPTGDIRSTVEEWARQGQRAAALYYAHAERLREVLSFLSACDLA